MCISVTAAADDGGGREAGEEEGTESPGRQAIQGERTAPQGNAHPGTFTIYQGSHSLLRNCV